MNCTQAKNISIVNFLIKIGYTPAKTTKKDTWFLSPFHNEKTASFKVCNSKNVWYDFSEGYGGTIIDLICKLNNCEIKQALEIISGDSFSFHKPKKKINTKNYTILNTQPISNKNLFEYLKDRRLNISFALDYCYEVHYKFENIKQYYAIGFKNDSNGYELRNKYFKGCLGKKDITTINNNSNIVSIFESWSDFISYLTLKSKVSEEDFIILNSTSMLKKNLDRLKNYETINVFFDNDNSGNNAYKLLKKSVKVNLIDKREHYKGYKDLNEFLLNY